MCPTPSQPQKKYAYSVRRWVLQEYFIESDEPLEKAEHIWGKLHHPVTENLEREIIRQVRP